MINTACLEKQSFNRSSGLRKRVTPSSAVDRALAGKVTELVLQDGDFNQIPMLLPLLAQISKAPRWLIWIAPPAMPPRELLDEAGIDLQKVILLQPDADRDCYQLACKALAAGTAHAVISWPDYLSADQIQGLEQAAWRGQSHGIVVRRRIDA